MHLIERRQAPREGQVCHAAAAPWPARASPRSARRRARRAAGMRVPAPGWDRAVWAAE
jgi:hypothetical protein